MTTFKKGNSGNPAGRPKGSGVAGRLRQAISMDIDAILSKLITQAKEGDIQAAKTLLDRVCPPLKAETQTISLAALAKGTLTEKAQAVLQSVGKGAIAPDVAAQLVQAVATLAKVVELDDIEKRLAALEGKE